MLLRRELRQKKPFVHAKKNVSVVFLHVKLSCCKNVQCATTCLSQGVPKARGRVKIGKNQHCCCQLLGNAGPSSRKKLELDLDEERGKSEDESECFLESESSSEDSETYEKMVDDELTDAVTTMRETQHFLNPQTKEKDLINKWFALVYVSKRERTLYIAKFIKRFLVDEDGLVDECLMSCLIPKIDSGTLLEGTPKHLPLMMGCFIALNSLLKLWKLGSSHFLVPDYENIL